MISFKYMILVEKDSVLWKYLPTEIQGLINDGEILLDHAQEHISDISDYSYLVFPFAKAYEGFLKRLFLDLNLIREDQYYGDDIRIGRILNPHFISEKENVFDKVCSHAGNGTDVAMQMWRAWKNGRNEVFHYFPHNFRRLTFEEASKIITELVEAMKVGIGSCSLKK